MSTWAADRHSGHEAGAPPPDLTGGITGQMGSLLGAGAPLAAAEPSITGQPLLTVIVPVYNEKVRVDRLLASVLDAPYSKQIVVVDDGSTDGSSELLQNWQRTGRIVLLTHPQNRGKGAAFRTGLACVRGRFALIQDADLKYDPQDFSRLIQPLLGGEVDAACGSRRLGCERTWRQMLNPFYHGVTLLNMCVRILYGVRITDEATCYKAFPTTVLRSMELTCQRFAFCPEATAKACRMRLHIREVPIRYTSRRVRDGKKIGLGDAIEAVRELWRWHAWQPTSGTATQAVRSPANQRFRGVQGRKRGVRGGEKQSVLKVD